MLIGQCYPLVFDSEPSDERSQLDTKIDLMCGLVALYSRYGFVEYV